MSVKMIKMVNGNEYPITEFDIECEAKSEAGRHFKGYGDVVVDLTNDIEVHLDDRKIFVTSVFFDGDWGADFNDCEWHILEPKIKVDFNEIKELADSLVYKFAVIEGTTTTVCKAILPNGFSVGTGESACIDPNEYNKELGEKYAKERAQANAVNELWKLEGYLLKVTGRTTKDMI